LDVCEKAPDSSRPGLSRGLAGERSRDCAFKIMDTRSSAGFAELDVTIVDAAHVNRASFGVKNSCLWSHGRSRTPDEGMGGVAQRLSRQVILFDVGLDMGLRFCRIRVHEPEADAPVLELGGDSL
jgi:hypothetical protein